MRQRCCFGDSVFQGEPKLGCCTRGSCSCLGVGGGSIGVSCGGMRRLGWDVREDVAGKRQDGRGVVGSGTPVEGWDVGWVTPFCE